MKRKERKVLVCWGYPWSNDEHIEATALGVTRLRTVGWLDPREVEEEAVSHGLTVKWFPKGELIDL